MQNCRTEVAQSIANLEALEKRVAMVKEVLVHLGLRKVRTEVQRINKKIFIIQGSWEVATTKLQGFDSEITNV